MSIRGDGRTTCVDCGWRIEPGYSGTPGCCKKCDGIEVCVSCGDDYGPGQDGGNGRCAMCDLCEAGETA